MSIKSIRTWWFSIVTLSLALPLTSAAGAQDPSEAVPKNPFFAFCMDTHDAKKRSLDEQAHMLKELGFDGAGHVGIEHVAERLRTLDEAGLKLFLVGLRVNLASGGERYPPQLKEVVPLLKGRGVAIYVTLVGMKPADPAGFEIALPILREIADLAAESEARVVLYPHTGDWLVHVDHAVQLAKEVDRPNLGVIFNLCHFLRNEDASTLPGVLESARPHLFMVSINGADLAGKSDRNWNRLIQPLDQGTFDVLGLLKTLKAQGYAGPVALMCYGIGGDAKEHLARSMDQWRRLQAGLRPSE
jgi:sugar phosphate isomerase/epimerase